jgi:hypothetical protein
MTSEKVERERKGKVEERLGRKGLTGGENSNIFPIHL